MPAGEDEDPLPSVLTQPPQNRCLVPPCKGLLPARPLKTPLERLSRRPVFFNRSIPMGFGSQPAAQEELFLCRHLKGEQQIADIRAFIFHYFCPHVSGPLEYATRNAERSGNPEDFILLAGRQLCIAAATLSRKSIIAGVQIIGIGYFSIVSFKNMHLLTKKN